MFAALLSVLSAEAQRELGRDVCAILEAEARRERKAKPIAEAEARELGKIAEFTDNRTKLIAIANTV